MTTSTMMLDAALGAVARGWHVLPVANAIVSPDGSVACSCSSGESCRETAKHPLYQLAPNGQSNATTDPDVIRRWWAAYPDASIGVVLVPSGLIAFDADFYKGDGERIAALEQVLGTLPASVVQESGSGQGNHLIFKATGFPIRGQIGGVTMRGRNYIVLAPSTHKSGGNYRWIDGLGPDDVEVAELPESWREALRKPDPIGQIGAPDIADEPPWLTEIPQADRVAAMRAHLVKEKGEKMGVDRPGMAWDVARSCARLYAVHDGEEVFKALVEIYNPKCDPPYAEDKLAERVIAAYQRAHAPPWGHHFIPQADRLRAGGLGFVLDHLAEAPAATEPSREQIKADLQAARDHLKRAANGDKKYAGALLAKLLKGEPLTSHPDEDPDAALIRAAQEVLTAAPRGATTARLVEFFIASCPTRTTTELAAALDQIRPQIVIVPEGDGPIGHPAEGEAEPANDDELRARLLLTDGENPKPRVCGTNVEMILCYAEAFRGTREDGTRYSHLRFNDLTKRVECTGGMFFGQPPNSLDVAIRNWLEAAWGIFAPPHEVTTQLLHVTRTRYAYDPVAEYLRGLVWDGVPRIGTWLETYCNAETVIDGEDMTPTIRRIGAMWLVSAVARGIAPGCKVDTVLVLEGSQGARKSSALRVLGGEWFSDTPLSLGDKDSYQIATSTWIVELAELSSLSSHEVEKHKAFLSAQTDMFRPPYGRVPESFARHCAFAGSTNEKEYLKDVTGNRRFLAARVGRIDIEALARDRDQLWAEATYRYLSADLAPHLASVHCPGERWWFEDGEQLDADKLLSGKRAENAWVPLINDWAAKQALTITTGPHAGTSKRTWSLEEISHGALSIDRKDLQRTAKDVSRALREAGWEKDRVQVDGERRWVWYKPGLRARVTAGAVDAPSVRAN